MFKNGWETPFSPKLIRIIAFCKNENIKKNKKRRYYNYLYFLLKLNLLILINCKII